MAASPSPKFDLTTIGEIMTRLSVPVGQRLADARQLDVEPGGAEGNVCATLTGLGYRCSWLSRLPNNPLAHMIIRRLRAFGIDTDGVVLPNEGRVGSYYVEFATAPRPIQVVYDRADSAMANMTSEDVNWEHLLDTRLVHLTGITPALSPACLQLTKDVVTRAKEARVPLSFDVNYRGLLWSEAEAAETLRPLMHGIDLVICGRGDAERLFGFTGENRAVLDALQAMTEAKRVVLTLSNAGAMAYDESTFIQQDAISAQIVDRLGAGDAFASGVIDGMFSGSLAEGLRRGVVLGALALSQHGDMLITHRAELESLLADNEGGIVR
ncbi:MAG: sugar kinase [Chloroflexota bacterium]